jgi:hypothetical protein
MEEAHIQSELERAAEKQEIKTLRRRQQMEERSKRSFDQRMFTKSISTEKEMAASPGPDSTEDPQYKKLNKVVEKLR